MKKGLMKKIIATALLGVMAIGLAGCGSADKTSEGGNEQNVVSNNETSEKDMLDVIKEKGKLVVGLSADYAPYEFHAIIDGKDEIVGFDIEIAKEIATALDVELEIQEMEFDALVAAIPAGKIDVAISGMNPTEERAKVVDFSEIYYTSQHGVLTTTDNKDKYNTLDDLEGLKVGAQLGSTQAEMAREIEGATLQLLANVNTLILELKSGKVDALVMEKPVAEMAVKANPELALANVTIEDEGGGNAVAMKKGSPKLLEEVNKVITELNESGKMAQFISDANDLAAQQAE